MPRADAERNRARILEVARAAFAAAGDDAIPSMAEIARRADVGMATLYRNFPGRRDLLEALYADEVAVVIDTGSLTDGRPGDALAEWLRRFVAFSANKHPIATELLADDDALPVLESSRDRVLAAGTPLLTAAQAAGELRAGLTLRQVIDLVMAATGAGADAAQREVNLQIVLAGLRPDGAGSSSARRSPARPRR